MKDGGVPVAQGPTEERATDELPDLSVSAGHPLWVRGLLVAGLPPVWAGPGVEQRARDLQVTAYVVERTTGSRAVT